MVSKKKIVILLPIWGVSYLEKFMKYGLSSIFGQKELINLCDRYQIHLVLLTSASDEKYFKSHNQSLFLKSNKHINIKFIIIDDIISYFNGGYGGVLSIAYFRGMQEYNKEWQNTIFLYLVGDYVLSHNLLINTIKKIERGANVIFSVSLRCIDDAVITSLGFYRHSHRLQIPPREAIFHGLSALHPSFKAKVFSNQLVRSKNIQHFYWQVDSSTLIARCFMLHPLAIKPTHWIDYVPGFIDYAFVQEFAPKGPFESISDSDDGAILELQTNPSHESHFSEYGSLNLDKLATEVSSWATDYFLNLSQFPFVLHSNDIPIDVKVVQDYADRFMSDLISRVNTSSLQDPLLHYDWVNTLSHFVTGISNIIPELHKETIKKVLTKKYENNFNRLKIFNTIMDRIDGTHLINKKLFDLIPKSNEIVFVLKNERECLRLLGKNLYQGKYYLSADSIIKKSVKFSDHAISTECAFKNIVIMLPLADGYLIDQIIKHFRDTSPPNNVIVILSRNPEDQFIPNESMAWVLKHQNITSEKIFSYGDARISIRAYFFRKHLETAYRELRKPMGVRSFANGTVSILKSIYQGIKLIWCIKQGVNKTNLPFQLSRVVVIRGQISLPKRNSSSAE